MKFFFKKKALRKSESIILDGAYHLHREEDIARFTGCVGVVFPQHPQRFRCFGADWMGRQFALDQARIVSGEPEVALLDPVTEEIFEIPCGYRHFHKVEMFQYPNETVEHEKFKKWLSSGGRPPKYGECVSHTIPLRLEGKDTFDNFEISDLEVSWSISGQIHAQTRGIPAGTPIGKVAISEE